MNVICTDVERAQIPLSLGASIENGLLDGLSALRIQVKGRMTQKLLVELVPVVVTNNSRRFVKIVVPVYRTTLISMKPGSVCSEGEENG
jgi:hypothetical protein